MKFNMVCIKFDQKNLKNLNFSLQVFKGFFKNLKKPRFFSEPFSSPDHSSKVYCTMSDKMAFPVHIIFNKAAYK